MIVKICGLTVPEQAAACAELGADWIGINFWPESSRFVETSSAGAIAAAARAANPDVELVGIFVNQSLEDISAATEAATLSRIQLHGDESPAFVAQFGEWGVRALRLQSAADVAGSDAYDCPVLLVDAAGGKGASRFGGSGEEADWELAKDLVARARGKDVLLAGGLGPDNVLAAVLAVSPWGVDVASGVEASPGIKDLQMVKDFIDSAKGAKSAKGEP